MSHDKPEEEEILTMIMPRLSCGMFSSESCLMAMKFRSPGRAHRPHQHKQKKHVSGEIPLNKILCLKQQFLQSWIKSIGIPGRVVAPAPFLGGCLRSEILGISQSKITWAGCQRRFEDAMDDGRGTRRRVMTRGAMEVMTTAAAV